MIHNTKQFFDTNPYLGFITGLASGIAAIYHFFTADATIKLVGFIGVYAGTAVAIMNLSFGAHTRWVRWRNRHKN
jgi:hypothetical protein